MTITPQFVRFYNETFKFIEEHCGYGKLEAYWIKIAPILLYDLKLLAEAKGIWGCGEYWANVLREEGAVHKQRCWRNLLEIEITDCPALEALDNPCKHYCDHCDVMYRAILEPLGFEYKIDFNRKGQCTIFIRKGTE